MTGLKVIRSKSDLIDLPLSVETAAAAANGRALARQLVVLSDLASAGTEPGLHPACGCFDRSCGLRPRGLGGSLLCDYVRPDVVDQLLLCDHLTRTLGKVDQNIQCPIPKRKHLTVAPEHPLANRKFERVKPQLPVNYGRRTCFSQMTDFLCPVCLPSVGKRRNCARVKLAPTKLVVFPSPLERAN